MRYSRLLKSVLEKAVFRSVKSRFVNFSRVGLVPYLAERKTTLKGTPVFDRWHECFVTTTVLERQHNVGRNRNPWLVGHVGGGRMQRLGWKD